MFVMDMPPDVPPQYAPIVVAEASQAKQESKERTIGVCHLIDSRPTERLSAVNSLSIARVVDSYLKYKEHQPIDDLAFLSAKITLLQAPKHGTLDFDEPTKSFGYTPNAANFEGADQATFLVEIGRYKVKVIYFFNVMTNVPGSGEEGEPEFDKTLCPNGPVWKISLNPDDPNAPIAAGPAPSSISSGTEPTTPTTPTTPSQGQYDAVMSICQFVLPATSSDVSAFNVVAPVNGAGQYLRAHGIVVDPNAEIQVTIQEGPRHGKLGSDGYVNGVYLYNPVKGYLGSDQMTFVVEVQGKKFKIIYSVYVGPGAPEYGPEDRCPSGFQIKEIPNRAKGADGGSLDVWELSVDGPTVPGQRAEFHAVLSLRTVGPSSAG